MMMTKDPEAVMMTVAQFWSLLSVIFGIAIGGFSWIIWATRTLSKHGIKIALNDERWKEEEVDHRAELLKQETERTAQALAIVTSQEKIMTAIHDGNRAIYFKLDGIVENTGKMQINCGVHAEKFNSINKAVDDVNKRLNNITDKKI